MKHTETIARSMRNQIQRGADIGVILSKTEETLKEHKQQLFFLPALKYLSELLKRDQVFDTLVVQSPFTLEETQIDQISKKITGQTNTPRVLQIDTSLLAGFRATYRGNVYDGSARQYITRLGKQ